MFCTLVPVTPVLLTGREATGATGATTESKCSTSAS